MHRRPPRGRVSPPHPAEARIHLRPGRSQAVVRDQRDGDRNSCATAQWCWCGLDLFIFHNDVTNLIHSRYFLFAGQKPAKNLSNNPYSVPDSSFHLISDYDQKPHKKH